MVQWRTRRGWTKRSASSDHRRPLPARFPFNEGRQDDNQVKAPESRVKGNSLMLDTWLWEITAMIFSTLCFVAVVAVLGAYDRKATPNFPKGLNLNTIISILTTASKSSLLCMVGTSIGQLKWIWVQADNRRPLYDLQSFDDASRGPWGSLKLLFHRPKKERWLVSLGAIITIISLLFDPSMHQIVSYPAKETSSNSKGALAKQVDVPWHLSSPGEVDMGLIGALNVGIWTNGFELDPICPSGNCTWPQFRSAGWCSKCEDVTSDATFVGCDFDMFNTSSHDPQVVSCNITLPDKNSIVYDLHSAWGGMSVHKQHWDPGFIVKIPSFTVSPVNNRWGPYFNQTILGVPGPLGAIAMVDLDPPPTFTSPNFRQVLRPKNITQCVLSPCMRAYRISVSGGIPRVQTLSTDFGEIFQDNHVFNRDYEDLDDQFKSCWKLYHDQVANLSQYQETIPIKWRPWENSTQLIVCPVTEDLTGFGLAGMEYYVYKHNETINMWDSTDQTSNGTMINQRLISSSFDSIISNISASMTKYAHEHLGHDLRGVVMETQGYVVVEWYFIILPSLLIALGVVFLVLTICLNNRCGLCLWKSSLLPVLYHRPAEGIDSNELDRPSAMERSASEHTVTLGIVDRKRRLILSG